MLSFRKPPAEKIRRKIAHQAQFRFTYSDVGITRDDAAAQQPPANYVVDHTRVELGTGKDIFLAATQALARWEQFHLGWLEATPTDTPLIEGNVIAVVARAFGIWWLNLARIVYTIDDQTGPIRRFGFGYGTLPDHVESGEERFLIEWNSRDDSVHYDVLALSRPRHPLAKLGYPLVRRAQRRFGHESAAAMLRSVGPIKRSRLDDNYRSVAVD